MSTSYDQGFSCTEKESTPGLSAAAAAAGGGGGSGLEAGGWETAAAVPAAPGGVSAAAGGGGGSAASSSAGIADDDLRDVASMLVKRLSSGVPLTPSGFGGFSDAVDRIIESTAAGSD